MKVTLQNGKTVYVKITHNRFDNINYEFPFQGMTAKERKTYVKDNGPYTQAEVSSPHEIGEPIDITSISVGHAYGAPEDAFSKRKGSRLALSRALRSSTLSKDERRQVFNTVFVQHKPKDKVSVKVDLWEIVSREVEGGANLGCHRAHKHTDKPSVELIVDEVVKAVMNNLSEVIQL